MATVLQSRKSAEPAKHDQVVEQQLNQAESRIRRLDLTVGGLGLLAAFLAFVLSMVLLDRYLELSDQLRQAALIGFTILGAIYSYFFIVRPLRRRINPYYAARQVEQSIPDAKNSIVNYLDLKDEDLSPAIKAAVGNRAAKDIKQADLDEAIRGRQAVWLGWFTAALFVAALITLVILRPTQFFSLLSRALSPFESRAIATRTSIAVTVPDGGNATVVLGQSVLIQVTVDGRVPEPQSADALTLRLRYDPTDPTTVDMPLEPGGDNRTFQLRLPAKLIQNGFWYVVTGGDDRTPEYRIAVKSLPLFEGFEVRYDYPAYLRWESQTSKKVGCQDPVQAIRGTTVTLIANTNRTVREGRMVIDGQPGSIPGQLVAGSPQSLQFTFRLDQDANYRIFFTSNDGEQNQDPKAYQLRVLSDQAPRIEWVEPEQEEITLPANDILKLKAVATDDFGLSKMAFLWRVVEPLAADLEGKPYRGGKSFLREEDQSYPRRLEYQDFLELTKTKAADGQPHAWKEGMLVEFWLQAEDNCRVVDATGKELIPVNVGKSSVRRLRIAPPKKEDKEKLDQKRQQLEQQQQKHEQQQDNKNQNEPRDPQQPQEEQDQPGENQKPQQGEQKDPKNQPKNEQPMGQKDPMKNADPKQGDMGNQGEPMKDPMQGNPEGQPMKNMGDGPKEGQPMNPENPNDSKEKDPQNLEDKAREIEKTIDRQPPKKGEDKGDKQPKNDGEREAPAEPKEGDGMGMNPENPADAKPNPQPMNGQGGEAGEQKQQGNVEQPPEKAESKEKGEGQQQPGGEGEAKNPPFGGGDTGEKKEKGKADAQPNNQQNMGGGNEQPMPNPMDMGGQNQQAAKNEPGQGKGKSSKKEAGQGQPQPMNPEQGENAEENANQGENAANPGQSKQEKKADRGQSKESGDTGENGAKEPKAGQAKAEKSPDRAQAKNPPKENNGENANAQAKEQGMGGMNDTAKAEPKQGGANDQPMNPMEGQKQVAKGQPKPDQGNPQQGQGDDAQAKAELEKLARDLKSNDPATREAAEKKLDQLKREAGDQQARNNIDEAMKKAGQDQPGQADTGDKKETDPQKAQNAAQPKPEPKNGETGDASAKKGPPKEGAPMGGERKEPKSDARAQNNEGQAKPEPKEQLGEPGECKECKNPGAGGSGKSAGSKAPMGQKPQPGEEGVAKANPRQGDKNGTGEPMKNMGEPMKNMGDPMNNPMKNMGNGEQVANNNPNPEGENKPNPENQPKGEPKGMNPGDGLGPWGNPAGNERTQPSRGGDNPQAERAAIDEEAKRRATDLQLEKLKQNADNQELLKKLNMTREEYQRFLESYEKMVQRQTPSSDIRDDQKTGPRKGQSVANQGSRRIETGNTSDANTNRVGPVFAPSEFRNPFKEFSEELSRIQSPKK